MRDRTTEFTSILQSMQSSHSYQPLINQPIQQISASDFSKASQLINKELQNCLSKLSKLTKLAKTKSLFDDKPVEINELVFVIKQDLAKINKLITTLSGHYANQSSQKSQHKEHEANVITSLQSKLADTSNQFKTILEIRTENMKDQKERREKYSFSGSDSNGPQFNSDSPLYNPSKQPSQISSSNGDTVLDFGSSQEQSLVQSNSVNMEIINSRDQAIESIESTIAELGQIYQHFALLLSSQREAVQRIDENVLDSELNVEMGHQQLMKFYQNASNNRWLIVKSLSVIIFFFMIFVVFMQ